MQSHLLHFSVNTWTYIIFFSYWALASIPLHHKEIHIIIFLAYLCVPAF